MADNRFVLQVPAKVNLRLKIEGRQSDGYHRLSMLNSTIALFDTLTVRISNGNEFSLAANQPREFCKDNLVERAVSKFKIRFNLKFSCECLLEKRIPIGGGLGGGSSDAASILDLLAREFLGEAAVNNQECLKLACELGSDVPFFLHGGLAKVFGLGDEVISLRESWPGTARIYLVIPSFGCSTSQIYQATRQSMPTESFVPDDLLRGTEFITWANLSGLIENDLEPVVLELVPKMGKILEDLRRLPATTSSITGSGSTIFVLPEGKDSLSKIEFEELDSIARRHSCRLHTSTFLLNSTTYVN